MVRNKTHKKRQTTKKRVSSTKKKENSKSYLEKFFKLEHELPLGIRVLIVYLLLLSFFYLFIGFGFRRAMIFGFILEGGLAFLINAATIALLLFIVYGFAKKDVRHYYASIIFFVLIILNTLLSIFSLRLQSFGALKSFVNVSFYLTLILNVITLLFLFRKKYYFITPKPEYTVHYEDRFFVLSIVVIWVLLILSTFYYGEKYYDESFQTADQYLLELRDRSVIESISYCEEVSNKDLCYYISALINKEDANSLNMCEMILNPIYRTDCKTSIK
ncbi:DUF998 domain-containing protein [Candidatus Woesearchaeota archaeon]|nr:DUF998 domain-containing protein [Candidatus Woesearchaeota archaeon]